MCLNPKVENWCWLARQCCLNLKRTYSQSIIFFKNFSDLNYEMFDDFSWVSFIRITFWASIEKWHKDSIKINFYHISNILIIIFCWTLIWYMIFSIVGEKIQMWPFLVQGLNDARDWHYNRLDLLLGRKLSKVEF